MVVEGLIWSFCLAFGRTPPVGCCGMDSDRTLHAGAGGGCGRSSAIRQNLLEHLPWDGDLEGDIAAVADDLCADLDQLLSEARQRPVLDRLRRCQRAQEIVGERMKLEPYRVGGERLARQPGWTKFSGPTQQLLAKTSPRLEHLIPAPRTIPLPQ